MLITLVTVFKSHVTKMVEKECGNLTEKVKETPMVAHKLLLCKLLKYTIQKIITMCFY